jgi:HTH-type transcriptional regulator/antitoxin HigA
MSKRKIEGSKVNLDYKKRILSASTRRDEDLKIYLTIKILHYKMAIKIIKTEEEYFNTLKRIEEIFDAVPGTPEGDELELLSLIVGNYEDEHYPIPDPDPIEAIEFIMEQTDMKPKYLVGIICDKASVSKILNRKRKLTLEMIRNLHDKLSIPFDALLKEYSIST